jgi:Cu/Ag efflux protein CusF
MARLRIKWLDSEAATSGQVPTADGSGGAAWQDQAEWALVVTITSAASPYTITTATTVLCNATGGAITVNLPAASGNSGKILNIKKTDSSANQVTVDGNAAETIDGALTQVLKKQWASLQLQSDGANWYIL